MDFKILLPGLIIPSEMTEVMRSSMPSSFSAIDIITSKSTKRRHETPLSELMGHYFLKGSLKKKCLQDLGLSLDLYDKALLASPVSARADMDSLFMLGTDSITMTTQEALELELLLNDFFQVDQIQFHHLDNLLWLITSENSFEFDAPSIWDMQGHMRSMGYEGKDATKIEKIITLSQMFLHDHPFNQKRSSSDLPEVNSFVFWNDIQSNASFKNTLRIGDLPFFMSSKDDENSPVLHCDHIHFDEILEFTQNNKDIKNIHLYLNDLNQCLLYSDAQLWQQTLMEINEAIFESALKSLQRKELSSLQIIFNEGEFYLPRHYSLYFWRQVKPFKGSFK